MMLILLIALTNPALDELPPNPGHYEFLIECREGYSWNGKPYLLTNQKYFKSQVEAFHFYHSRVNWNKINSIQLYRYNGRIKSTVSKDKIYIQRWTK